MSERGQIKEDEDEDEDERDVRFFPTRDPLAIYVRDTLSRLETESQVDACRLIGAFTCSSLSLRAFVFAVWRQGRGDEMSDDHSRVSVSSEMAISAPEQLRHWL